MQIAAVRMACRSWTDVRRPLASHPFAPSVACAAGGVEALPSVDSPSPLYVLRFRPSAYAQDERRLSKCHSLRPLVVRLPFFITDCTGRSSKVSTSGALRQASRQTRWRLRPAEPTAAAAWQHRLDDLSRRTSSCRRRQENPTRWRPSRRHPWQGCRT
jgi:hypothetical protein